MKIDIYALRDEKAGVFLKTFPERSEASVTRDFGMAVFQSDTQVSKYPEDYSIYKIANFDDVSGEYKNYTPIACVIRGSEVLKNPEKYMPTAKKEINKNGTQPKIPHSV